MLKQIRKELAKAMKFLSNQKFEATKYSTDEVKISDRSVGGKVELIDADGTLLVAPDGDYELSDGFTFTVKDGVIDSITDKSTEEFADESELTVGDEVTMSEDSADYMPWYAGVNFYVYSIDASYGVSLANKSGRYIASAKPESLTKTGGHIEFPKDDLQFADETSDNIDALKAENANLKSAIESILTTIQGLTKAVEDVQKEVEDATSESQTEVQEFKKEVSRLNQTILKLAKLPAEPSKVTKNTVSKDKTDAKQMEFISALRGNK